MVWLFLVCVLYRIYLLGNPQRLNLCVNRKCKEERMFVEYFTLLRNIIKTIQVDSSWDPTFWVNFECIQ